jgi:hypothetical protein
MKYPPKDPGKWKLQVKLKVQLKPESYENLSPITNLIEEKFLLENEGIYILKFATNKNESFLFKDKDELPSNLDHCIYSKSKDHLDGLFHKLKLMLATPVIDTLPRSTNNLKYYNLNNEKEEMTIITTEFKSLLTRTNKFTDKNLNIERKEN